MVKLMKYIDTPQSLVEKWVGMVPGLWDDLDLMQHSKDSGPGWPDECAVPMGAAAAAMTHRGEDMDTAERMAAEATACYLWRKNKIIYQLDSTMAAVFQAQARSMDEDKELPVDYLLHLPYPCIYVDTDIYDGFVGFFAWIEWDVNCKRYELRASWRLPGGGGTWPSMLHILPGKTLLDCADDTFAAAMGNIGRMKDGKLIEVPGQVQKEAFELPLFAAQVILYLNSVGADVYRTTPAARKQGKKKHAKIGIGRDPIIFEVGMRMGATIRAAEKRSSAVASPGTGTSKRPHARRGHWHHYWAGPKDDRKLILKWTTPTFVHPEAGREDNVVAIKVK